MKGNWQIQSVIFNRDFYPNKISVKNWILMHGFILQKKKEPIKKYDNTYRVRQRNPNKFKKFKVIYFKKGKIKAIYGLKK